MAQSVSVKYSEVKQAFFFVLFWAFFSTFQLAQHDQDGGV